MKSNLTFIPIIKGSGLDTSADTNSMKSDEEPLGKNLLKVETANAVLNAAKLKPTPKQLFGCIWHEGELCILVANTGAGKSILAVQIGNNISKSLKSSFFKSEANRQPVLYFDFELSEKQFQGRYSESNSNNEITLYEFADDFFRVSIDPDFSEVKNIDVILMNEIEKAILMTEAKILIIDNITYLSTTAMDTAKEALPLMQKLKSLKSKYGLSILVLAHTPKRGYMSPISINDISGSKHLANFADSIFAIGQSNIDKSVRYIKQLKARETEIEYDSENVIECNIQTDFNYLHFAFLRFGRERDHLQQTEPEELESQIISLHETNPELSLRELAELAGTNHMKVKRILDRLQANKENLL